MKVYNVPVSITRADLLEHCGSCKCRSARKVIAKDFVEVFAMSDDVTKIKRAAISRVESNWHEERKKDWDRYEFEAEEPVLIRESVVTS